MPKVWFIGTALNPKTGHPFQIRTDTEEECKERLIKFCTFFDISKFTIYKCVKTIYRITENGED